MLSSSSVLAAMPPHWALCFPQERVSLPFGTQPLEGSCWFLLSSSWKSCWVLSSYTTTVTALHFYLCHSLNFNPWLSGCNSFYIWKKMELHSQNWLNALALHIKWGRRQIVRRLGPVSLLCVSLAGWCWSRLERSRGEWVLPYSSLLLSAFSLSAVGPHSVSGKSQPFWEC